MVVQTADGGFVLCGMACSFGDAQGDVYIVKTDGDGVGEWSRTYGGSGAADEGFQVLETSTGEYVVAGRTNSLGAGSADAYLLKLDADGDMLWTKTYGTSGYDEAKAVGFLPGGGMCVIGATYSFGAVLSDVMVVKTNADGDTLWLRTFGGPDYEFGDAVCTTSDGSCVIAGQVIPSGGGNADVYIVKVNAGGGKVWEKTYGGAWADYGQAICPTDDGDFQAAVFIGYTIDIHLDVSGDAYAYYHVTATDFAGNEGEPATTDNTFAVVAGGSVPAAFALGRNTPNPFAVRTEVAFEVPSTARVSLQVVDVGGRVVRSLVDRTLAAGRYSVGWDGRDGTGRDMGPGVYFVRMAAGEFSATRKMMLIK